MADLSFEVDEWVICKDKPEKSYGHLARILKKEIVDGMVVYRVEYYKNASTPWGKKYDQWIGPQLYKHTKELEKEHRKLYHDDLEEDVLKELYEQDDDRKKKKRATITPARKQKADTVREGSVKRKSTNVKQHLSELNDSIRLGDEYQAQVADDVDEDEPLVERREQLIFNDSEAVTIATLLEENIRLKDRINCLEEMLEERKQLGLPIWTTEDLIAAVRERPILWTTKRGTGTKEIMWTEMAGGSRDAGVKLMNRWNELVKRRDGRISSLSRGEAEFQAKLISLMDFLPGPQHTVRSGSIIMRPTQLNIKTEPLDLELENIGTDEAVKVPRKRSRGEEKDASEAPFFHLDDGTRNIVDEQLIPSGSSTSLPSNPTIDDEHLMMMEETDGTDGESDVTEKMLESPVTQKREENEAEDGQKESSKSCTDKNTLPVKISPLLSSQTQDLVPLHFSVPSFFSTDDLFLLVAAMSAMSPILRSRFRSDFSSFLIRYCKDHCSRFPEELMM